ncbi:hypothetical protein DNTS_016083, partial [Danionella cerebrum]
MKLFTILFAVVLILFHVCIGGPVPQGNDGQPADTKGSDIKNVSQEADLNDPSNLVPPQTNGKADGEGKDPDTPGDNLEEQSIDTNDQHEPIENLDDNKSQEAEPHPQQQEETGDPAKKTDEKKDGDQNPDPERDGDPDPNTAGSEKKAVPEQEPELKESAQSSHFFAYLVCAVVLVAVLYIASHNKRK